MRKNFTLAEILITLAVIGIVAAIIMPSLLATMNNKIRNSRITNIRNKLRQGTDKLMVLDGINKYESTDDFVKTLAKHMKISSYCSASRLGDCYPYKKIYSDNEEGIDVSSLSTPEAFGLSSDDYFAPVSFITADGTPYIIMYKKVCEIDEGDGRSDTTSCIASIYDWNGSKSPNKFISSLAQDKIAASKKADIQFLGEVPKLGGRNVILGDSLFNRPTPGGYTYFKILDGTMNWSNAKNACPEGLVLTPKTDLMATYCEANGPSATFFGSVKTDCKEYADYKNEALSEKFYHAPSSVFGAPEDGNSAYAWRVGNAGGVYLNAKTAKYAVICVGK